MISIIAAIGKNRELGSGNKLIWQLPGDMRFFRMKTKGHPIIMGRKTHESILGHLGKPLPDRTTIVITSKPEHSGPNGVLFAASYENAIEIAHTCDGHDEVFVGGGASVYSQALNTIDRMYLTHIQESSDYADAYFPDFDEEDFIVSEIGSYNENGTSYTICQYDRRR